MRGRQSKFKPPQWLSCFLSEYRWFRKWHGGHWERWWIPMCASAIWLNYDKPNLIGWRQPCSEGPCMGMETYE